MNGHPEPHHRRSIRLRGFDYSQPGAYFVTVVTQNRECLFGEVVGGEMRLNDAGRMVQAVWTELPNHYLGIEPGAFIVMPNHIHAIAVLVGAAPRGRPGRDGPLSLPDVVHRFKTLTTKRYADVVKQRGWPPFRARLWQRNYYEHIIRDGRSLDRIRNYIAENPLRWEFDRENSLVRSADTARARPDKPWLV